MRNSQALTIAGGLQTLAGSILIHGAVVGVGVQDSIRFTVLFVGAFVMMLGTLIACLPYISLAPASQASTGGGQRRGSRTLRSLAPASQNRSSRNHGQRVALRSTRRIGGSSVER